MCSPAPIATRNAFDPIADMSDSYPVPIFDLVVTNRRQLRKRTKKTTAEKKCCSTGCECQDHDVREDGPALEVADPGCSSSEPGAGAVPLRVVLQGSTIFSTAEDNCMTSIVGELGRTRLGSGR